MKFQFHSGLLPTSKQIYPLTDKPIIISIFFGTYIIQYLTWAPVGSTDLSDFGISTRYFIPFFTLLPVVFNLNKDIKKDRLNLIIIMFVLSFLSGILVYILSLFY